MDTVTGARFAPPIFAADGRPLVSVEDCARWLMSKESGRCMPYVPAVELVLDKLQAAPQVDLLQYLGGSRDRFAELLTDSVQLGPWLMFDREDEPDCGRLGVIALLRHLWLGERYELAKVHLGHAAQFGGSIEDLCPYVLYAADARALFGFGAAVLPLTRAAAAVETVQPVATAEAPTAWSTSLHRDQWKDDRGRWTQASLAEWQRLRAAGVTDAAIGRLFGGISSSIIADKIGHKTARPKRGAQWFPGRKA